MNAMHGRSLLTGLILAAGPVLILPVSSANAEMWCRRDVDRNNPICMFSSAQDCVRAAGGICEREQLGRADVKPCKSSREAGAARKRRVAGSDSCDAS